MLEPAFNHGQLYVALSRVALKNNLNFLINNHGDMSNKYVHKKYSLEGCFTKSITKISINNLDFIFLKLNINIFMFLKNLGMKNIMRYMEIYITFN